MTDAVLSDGTILRFPDETPDEIIKNTVKQQVQARKGGAPLALPPDVTSSGENVRDASGVPGGATGPAAPPPDWRDSAEEFLKEFVLGPSSTITQNLWGAITSPLEAGRFITPYVKDDLRVLGKTFGFTDETGLSEEQAKQSAAETKDYYKPLDESYEFLRQNLPDPSRTEEGKAATRGLSVLAGGFKPTRPTELTRGAGAKLKSYGADLIGNAVVPEIGQELLGAVTAGTPLELPARILGAAGGNALTATSRAWNAADQVVRQSTQNVTEQQWDRAQQIKDMARQRNINVSGPQAVAHATGGASPLTSVLRVVEGNPVVGKQITGPFFAETPDQFAREMANSLDRIAVQAPNPEVLAPRINRAAEQVIQNTQDEINNRTRPLYRAAEPELIPAHDYAVIAADPRYAASLARLRNTPELADQFQGFPDNSVRMLDAVSKDLIAQGEMRADTANALYGPYLGGLQTGTGVGARNVARQHSVNYDQALEQQQQLRRDLGDPVGPGTTVGKLATAGESKAVGEAILPQKPDVGTGDAAEEAIAAISREAPVEGPQAVRQTIANRFDTAAKQTQEGDREFVGAKFFSDIAGSPARMERLTGVLRGLPGGAGIVADLGDLLEIMQASGWRKKIGSNTEFNRTLNEWLGEGSPRATAIESAMTLGGNWLTQIRDRAKRAAMRQNVRELADMFVDDDSIERMRIAGARGPQYAVPETAARTALQGLGLYYADREKE